MVLANLDPDNHNEPFCLSRSLGRPCFHSLCQDPPWLFVVRPIKYIVPIIYYEQEQRRPIQCDIGKYIMAHWNYQNRDWAKSLYFAGDTRRYKRIHQSINCDFPYLSTCKRNGRCKKIKNKFNLFEKTRDQFYL